MDDKKKFYLKWPWNLVVYAVLLVVLRIFAIPFIILIEKWNKNQQPDGPAEGYCMSRTRGRLTGVLWSLLALVIAFCCGFLFFMQIGADKTYWETADYATLIVCGVIMVGGGLLGVWLGYTAIRDSLVPEKSTLAKSIRQQLPYPDEAPAVKELFAMVDDDLKANGQWFDKVGVGKEWILGDVASYIPNIRMVFGRDEIIHRHSGNRTVTSRVIELYIIDDKQKPQVTSLKDHNELQPLMTCIRLRNPDALYLPYNQYSSYISKSNDEWETLMQEYNHRAAKRKSEDVSSNDAILAAAAAVSSEPYVPAPQPEQPREYKPLLKVTDTGGTIRDFTNITRRDVELAAQWLREGRYKSVYLEMGSPVIFIEAGDKSDGRMRAQSSDTFKGGTKIYETKCTDKQAEQWLLDMADGHFDPDFSTWKDITKKLMK